MKRREFITLLGGARRGRSCALAAANKCTLIGFLGPRRPDPMRPTWPGFLRGLKEVGMSTAKRGDRIPLGREPDDRLPALAAELVHRQVA